MGLRAFLIAIGLAASAAAQVIYDDGDGGRIAGPRAPQAAGGAGEPAGRQFADPRALEVIERLRALSGPELGFEFSPGEAHPRAVYGLRLAASAPVRGPSGTGGLDGLEAERAARSLLEPDLLGVSPEEVSLAAVHPGQELTAVRFEQRHRGLPVLGGTVVVQLDASGAAASVLASLVRGLDPPGKARIGAAEAIEAAHRKLGAAPGPPPRSQRLAVGRIGGRDRLLWDLRLRARGKPWRVLVDALSGEVLGAGDLLKSAGCTGVPAPKGLAHSPSPAKGPAALRELPRLDCRSLTLSGSFARVHDWTGEDPFTLDPLFALANLGRMPSGQQGGVLFDSRDPGSIAQVNVYLHSTLFHDYVRNLGFRGLDRPLPAVANVRSCLGFSPCENAFYDPLFPYATGFGLLIFGTGPEVNFALDGDVVYHEYTHAVVDGTAGLGDDFFDPDLLFSMALNEAFADYFAASFGNDAALAEYAGVSIGQVPLRDLENDARWPDDVDSFDTHSTGLIWSGAGWEIRKAFAAAGQAGIERADRLLYNTLASLPSNADLLRAATALIATASSSGLSAAEVTTVKDVLKRRGLSATGGAPPTVVEDLAPGAEATGEIAAVVEGTFRLSPVQYRLVVPQDGVKLTLDLRGAQAGADLDLHVRHNSPVSAPRGSIVATHSAQGPGSAKTIAIDAGSVPPLEPGIYFIAIANRSPVVARYRLSAVLDSGAVTRVEPVPAGGSVSGNLAGDSLGATQYTLEVPAAAGKRLQVSAAAQADLELLIRRGRRVELGGEGRAIADLAVRSADGSPATTLGESTLPPLLSGTYYLALRSRTATPASFTLRAAVVEAPPVVLEEAPLASGQTASGTVEGAPEGAGLLHPRQYTVVVPQDGSEILLTLKTAGDLGLYLRREARVDVSTGVLRFDHAASAPGAGDESLSVSLFSSPRLEPGRYFAAVVNRGGAAAGFTLRADVATAAAAGTIQNLQSGVWIDGVAEASGGPGGKLSSVQYRLAVPGGAGGLDVITNPKVPGDLDLYVRRGKPVQVIGGNVVADHRGVTERGAEAVTLFKSSLAPGDYFVALVNHAASAVGFQLIAVADANPISVPAADGDVLEGSLSRAPNPPTGCTLGISQIAVEVPAAASRLEFAVETPDGGPLQILMRQGARILIDLGDAVFDRSALTTDGPMVVSGADLRAGLYCFTLANCQATAQRFVARVRVEVLSAPEVALEDAVPAGGLASAGARGRPTLHTTQYTIDVPPGTAELVIGAWEAGCAEADLDLHVGYGGRVTIDAAGGSSARWRAERAGAGGETLVLTGASQPPLAPGRYFIAVLNRELRPVEFRAGAALSTDLTVPLAAGGQANGTAATSGQQGVGALHRTQYRVEVFPGAESLILDLAGNGDVDLILRYGLTVAIGSGGNLIADWDSSTLTANERIVLPPVDRPGECLKPGVYFAAVGNFEPRPATFTLRAQLQGTRSILARIGDTVEGRAPPAAPGGLRPPDLQIAVEAPAGSPGFQVDLVGEGTGPAGNIDLLVRQGAPVEFGAAIAATYRSEGPAAVEWAAVPVSKLVPGRYFVAVASRTVSETPFTVRIRPIAESQRDLLLGIADGGVAEPSGALGVGWLSPEQFRLRVPTGAPGLWVGIQSDDPGSPLELHLRKGLRVEVEGKTVLADRSAGGEGAVKRVTLVAPPTGDYFIAVRNFRARNEPFRIESGTSPQVRPGDADETGTVDLTDAIVILQRLFLGGPAVCSPAADADATGTLDLTDAIHVLGYLYLAGPPPAPPFPGCAPAAGPLDPVDCTGAGCG